MTDQPIKLAAASAHMPVSWLEHLPPFLQEWRLRELEKGRNPDPYIVKHLNKRGLLVREHPQK